MTNAAAAGKKGSSFFSSTLSSNSTFRSGLMAGSTFSLSVFAGQTCVSGRVERMLCVRAAQSVRIRSGLGTGPGCLSSMLHGACWDSTW